MKSELVETIQIPVEDIHELSEHIINKFEKRAKEAFDEYIEENELDKKEHTYSCIVEVRIPIMRII